MSYEVLVRAVQPHVSGVEELALHAHVCNHGLGKSVLEEENIHTTVGILAGGRVVLDDALALSNSDLLADGAEPLEQRGLFVVERAVVGVRGVADLVEYLGRWLSGREALAVHVHEQLASVCELGVRISRIKVALFIYFRG